MHEGITCPAALLGMALHGVGCAEAPLACSGSNKSLCSCMLARAGSFGGSCCAIPARVSLSPGQRCQAVHQPCGSAPVLVAGIAPLLVKLHLSPEALAGGCLLPRLHSGRFNSSCLLPDSPGASRRHHIIRLLFIHLLIIIVARKSRSDQKAPHQLICFSGISPALQAYFHRHQIVRSTPWHQTAAAPGFVPPLPAWVAH